MATVIEREFNSAVLRKALLLACQRIADGPQQYHEANTAAGWASLYVLAARTGKTPEQLIAEMTDFAAKHQ